MRLTLITSFAAILLVIPDVRGAVLWNNGPPDQQSGTEITILIMAEDFTLTAPAVLGGVRFWDGEGPFPGTNGYSGSITWTIYANNAGQPGAIIQRGNTSAVTRLPTGLSFLGLTEIQNDFALPSVALDAGTYWLGLHNGPLTHDTSDDFYWETTGNSAPNGISFGQSDAVPFDDGWGNSAREHAFVLTDAAAVVPLPAAAWAGFALLGGLGIRRLVRK